MPCTACAAWPEPMSLHIEVVGHGPPLVLVHGWGLHGGVFAPLVERLSGEFQLHLVDLPGHGHSRDDHTPLTLEACVPELLARTPPAVWATRMLAPSRWPCAPASSAKNCCTSTTTSKRQHKPSAYPSSPGG